MWNGFGTSKAAAAINGGGSDRRQATPRSLSFFLRQALLQGRDDVDHVAAGTLRRRRLALLTLGLGVDQFFNVFAVSVVIFGGIEFYRHAFDQLHGEIDFVRGQLFVDRQAELVHRPNF